MRSEAEIRRQVESRFHRWVYLFAHGGAWLAVAFGLFLYARRTLVPVGWTDSAFIVMVMWGMLVGLHFLRTVYVESREWLVRRTIDREMREYVLREAYEKRKRDEATERLSSDGGDGELIDFPDKPKAEYERRG
jgi:hypothetical protein